MGQMRPFLARKEKGQALALFIVILPAILILLLGVIDISIATSRLMDGVAVTDLAAHAGAQEIRILPNGAVEVTENARQVAANYFYRQAPAYVELTSIWCGEKGGRPACVIKARVKTAGLLLGDHFIDFTQVGYLVYGVTRGDQ